MYSERELVRGNMTIKLNGQVVERTSRNDLHNTFSIKHHKPHFVPSYKNLFLNQAKTNKGLLLANGILALTVLGIMVGCSMRVEGYKAEIDRLEWEIERSATIGMEMVDNYNKLESELASCSAKLPQKKVSAGKVSYYSKDGCLGCSPNQRMANGQIFDENAMTLAHNQIPLNTMVEVKNLDNGKVITAKVTDRGGFNKYSRVADLSKGLYLALGVKTDVSTLQFTWY